MRHSGLGRPRRRLLCLGFSVAVAQAVMIRESMGAMVGSELAWGAVLALWLGATAAGARVGGRLGGPGLASALPAISLLLAAAGVLMLRSAPALTRAVAGEALTTGHILWVLVLAVCPTAAAGGLAFPILAQSGRGATLSSAYGLESAGACAGGLCFSFLLAGRGTAAALCLALATVLAIELWPATPAAAGGRPNREQQPWWRRLGALVLLAASPLLAGYSTRILAELSWSWSGNPGKLGSWEETRHQRLEISDGTPAALYADGRLVASYPEPYLVRPRGHLLMLLHPDPRRVLLVNGLRDGTIEPLLEHPVERLEVIESDPAVPELLSSWYGPTMRAALADQRTSLAHPDVVRAIRSEDPWDLILLLGGNPINLRESRARTVELLRACRQRLSSQGRLVLSLDADATYLRGLSGRLIDITASTMLEAFDDVQVIPTRPMLLVATASETRPLPSIVEMEHRWQTRAVADQGFVPEMLELLLDRARAEAIETSLIHAAVRPGAEAARPETETGLGTGPTRLTNTLDHPRAVLVSVALAEGRGQPGLVALAAALEPLGRQRSSFVWTLILAMALATAVSGSFGRRACGVTTAVIIGAGSMGWWIMLLTAWQATRGSVYSEVGVLSALIMGGLAGGSLLVTKADAFSKPIRGGGEARSSGRMAPLPWLMVAKALLSLALANGAALTWSWLTIPVLLLVGGLLGGASFCLAARLIAQSIRRAAGAGWAADELGAASGALIVGLLALPLAGMATTGTALAAIQLATIPGLVLHGRR